VCSLGALALDLVKFVPIVESVLAPEDKMARPDASSVEAT
jgi:hypothetical protein